MIHISTEFRNLLPRRRSYILTKYDLTNDDEIDADFHFHPDQLRGLAAQPTPSISRHLFCSMMDGRILQGNMISRAEIYSRDVLF
jgi:hypothetical protein